MHGLVVWVAGLAKTEGCAKPANAPPQSCGLSFSFFDCSLFNADR